MVNLLRFLTSWHSWNKTNTQAADPIPTKHAWIGHCISHCNTVVHFT